MALFVSCIAACGNEDNEIVQQAGTNNDDIPFSATISIDNNAPTRALDENGTAIDASWAVGEKVALIHNSVNDEMTVTSVNSSGVATISGTLTGSPTTGDEVTIIYPSSASNGTSKRIKSDYYLNQDGTLTGH